MAARAATKAKAAPPVAAPPPAIVPPPIAPDPLAERQKEVIEEKKLVTGRISETTRYLGFGLLASFYAIVSSADRFQHQLALAHPMLLRAMALFGAFAILLDYLQYVFGRQATQNALDRKDKPYQYNKKWLSYRARRWCFLGKQVAALAGCALFLLIMAGVR